MSRGFVNAGHEVVGVDITDNHQYPYEFVHSDVFNLGSEFLQKFDLIHASPPCQHYSWSTIQYRNMGKKYPDLVDKTRQFLIKTDKPFIIENVVGAPIKRDLMLCGEMFGLRVIRHRIFEINGFTILQPKHEKHKLSVCDGTAEAVYGASGHPGCFGDKERQKKLYELVRKRKQSYYACVSGHGGNGYSYTLKSWQKAMGIDWITNKKHLAQAIPPKYAEYIGNSLYYITEY